MSTTPHHTLNLPRSLENGLVLRLASPADTEALAEFNGRIHTEADEPLDFIPQWTRVLMSGRHPTMKPEDFVLVVDTQTEKIVSATCLIPQVWRYEGVPIKVGRPELVGTDPDYRRRGLVRLIFEVIHQLSEAYGHHMQGITGIPWYYRQFGYEYALELGGGRDLPIAKVPQLKDGENEPYQIRPATEADIPALVALHRDYSTGPITAPAAEAHWRYDITDRNYIARINCLLDAENRVIGAYSFSADVWKTRIALWTLAVDPHVSIRAALPTVARALKARGEAYLVQQGDGKESRLETISFQLGSQHPAYEAFDAKLAPLKPPYSWYIRVANLPAFIGHIAPALEKRLVDSVMTGYCGELKLNFYQDGLRLVFEQGKITAVEEWQSTDNQKDNGDAGFPPRVFLKLLFGYRSLEELRHAFPDCWAEEEPTLLLNALFPQRSSWLMAIG